MTTATLTPEQIRQEVKGMVAELTECEPEEVTDTAHFVDELEVDSLMALELMVTLDKKYGIDLPEEEFNQIVNLQQAVEVVMKHLNNGTA